MADAWQTHSFEFKGGLITNLSPYQQGFQAPGSARILRNFEPSIFGGYRRVEGYEKFDTTTVPNTGVIRGIVRYVNQVYAVRGNDLFRSSGSGWTQISDNATYNSAGVTIGGSGKVRFLKYDFDGTEKLMLVDGTGKPYRFDGTTFEQLTSLPSDVSGSSFVVNFKNHIFFGNGKKIAYTAPYQDNDLTIASGGGIINVTDTITGLIVFREQLIIFSESSINVLNGNSVVDFQMQPVSRDLGCVAEDTIQEIGGDVIFLGPDGLRLFSATDRIGDFSLAAVSKPIQVEILDLISSSPNGFSSTVIREKSQYRIFGYNTGYTNDAAKGIGATQLEGGLAFNDLRGFNAFVTYSEYDGRAETIYFGATDGYIYTMEQGNSLDGAPIPAVFATPFIPLGDPKVRKTIYKSTTYLDVNGELDLRQTLKFDFDQPNLIQPSSISISSDSESSTTYGSGTFGTSTFGGKQQSYYEVPTTGSGFTVSVIYETDESEVDSTFTIDVLPCSILLTLGDKKMGTGYTRNDSANNIADGNVINASDLDGEFDAVQAAFNGTTGHSHDGTSGEGPLIAAGGIASNAVTTAKILDANVTTAKIADANVTLAKMAANSVDSDQYVNGSIDRVHLDADIVDGTKIADDSINSEHYVDGSIDTAHIADSQITLAKMAANSIDSAQYVDGSIDTAHIADSQVTTAKIADLNVTTAKISADAITAAKIGNDVINSEHIVADSIDAEHLAPNSVNTDAIIDDSVTSAHLAAGAVDTTALGADAVTNAKIADNAINSEHYTDGSIDRVHLAADIIDGTKIADDVINSEHYVAGSIDAEHLATDSVSSAKIVDGSVTTSKIATDAINGSKIADNVVLGGSPTTTTQSANNSSTRIATTAFVQQELGHILVMETDSGNADPVSGDFTNGALFVGQY